MLLLTRCIVTYISRRGKVSLRRGKEDYKVLIPALDFCLAHGTFLSMPLPCSLIAKRACVYHTRGTL